MMMKKIFSSLFILMSGLLFEVSAQTVTLNPTITPALFHYNDQITVSYDVSNTALANLTAAWVWVWMPDISGSGTNAKSNVNPATNNTTLTNAAKCTKSVSNGKTTFSITFVPSTFFSADISTQTKMGILLKGNDWSNGQSSDYVVNLLIGSSFQVTLTSPANQPLFVTNGDSVLVKASASASANFSLFVNGKLFDTQTAITNYQKKLKANDSIGYYQCFIVIKASESDTLRFSYQFHQVSPSLSRPAGIIDGINYHPSDQTKVTLSFWAPNKTSVYAFGDFTDWSVDPKYLMNKDGEHFWIEIDGLTPSQEYAFQYLVNDTLRIADPYADKILETDDNKIPNTTYPNLKKISSKALSPQWYFNHFSVFQTGQTPYQWQTTNYQKPSKEKLVIYELLIRDFFDSGHRNFQTLIDTIPYFKKLGITAIELMPVAEFNGEIGWGYNPTSMFAVEKYYGPKDKLKEFVDKCHTQGIAVILDIVMNHQDLPNSYAMLDFDFVNNHPKSTNKWFNVSAPHPYSVFYDLNHASTYTQKYLDTINYYWINEFKVDGFRYDLSKGFTQTNSGGDVNAWGQYDQSRINILERMANALWSKFPDAYIILEHFAANSEETALAGYQVDQGRGMMLWENFNYAYGQNTMGYSSGADISQMYYGNKGWAAARAVGYMESHDEEREMYRNLTYGNTSANYSVKNLSAALQRMKAAAVMFYTIPGPKMLWEFGELGYDFSINTCVSLSVNDSCRLTAKPVHWDYLQDASRKSLWNVISDLNRLRKNYSLFTTTGVAQMSDGSSLVQQIMLKNTPYVSAPVDSSQMNASAAANFDLTQQTVNINFAHDGTWYDYYAGGVPVSVASNKLSVQLQPGEYKLYTDIRLKTPAVLTAIAKEADDVKLFLYPNPTHGQLVIETDHHVYDLQARSITGTLMSPSRVDQNMWDVTAFSSGLYIIEITTEVGVVRKKLIKY